MMTNYRLSKWNVFNIEFYYQKSNSYSHSSWFRLFIVLDRVFRTSLIASSGLYLLYIRHEAANVPARPSPPLQWTTTFLPFFKYSSTTFFTKFLYFSYYFVTVLSLTAIHSVAIPYFLHSCNKFGIFNSYISSSSSRQTSTSIL